MPFLSSQHFVRWYRVTLYVYIQYIYILSNCNVIAQIGSLARDWRAPLDLEVDSEVPYLVRSMSCWNCWYVVFSFGTSLGHHPLLRTAADADAFIPQWIIRPVLLVITPGFLNWRTSLISYQTWPIVWMIVWSPMTSVTSAAMYPSIIWKKQIKTAYNTTYMFSRVFLPLLQIYIHLHTHLHPSTFIYIHLPSGNLT
jgi:hypothetical protein